MTCLEVQSNIISYIDDGLEKDKKNEFLKHVESCKDCKEELDIYYTMIEGMRQMDSNLPISRDFRAELDLRIKRELKQNRNRKKLLFSTIVMTILGVLAFSIIAYINFLNILYNDEQEEIKQKQGQYYYSAYFDDVLFDPEPKQFNVNIEPKEITEQSFYSKIRQYNANNR